MVVERREIRILHMPIWGVLSVGGYEVAEVQCPGLSKFS